MTIPFHKLSATGNDFVVIDHRNPFLNQDELSQFAVEICQAHTGIGADGVLLLENARDYAFRMIYYNADGSRAAMCGNGGRALGWFARQFHLWDTEGIFVADDGEHLLKWEDDNVGISLTIHGTIEEVNLADIMAGWYLNTGVPHLVLLSDDVQHEDVTGRGRKYRFDSHFVDGTNVNFMEMRNDGIHLRTYERGVEDETLACGTGSLAAAAVASEIHHRTLPVNIHMPGGVLRIVKEKGHWMILGGVEEIFRGEVSLGNRITKYIS